MKRRKVRILASALALALTISMSGCTVSINMENKNKKETETTETAETKEETTEKETKKAKEETKKADPTATPTPEPTATPVPQSVEQTQQAADVASQQGTTQIQHTTMFVTNCKEFVTLRPGPSAEGEICTINYGEPVTYLGVVENGFYKVSYSGNEGYVAMERLSTEKPSEKTTSAPVSSPLNASYGIFYVQYCDESISLRPEPRTDSTAICQIPLGESVSVYGKAENGFYQVSYNGKMGYALAQFLIPSTGSAPYSVYVASKCDEFLTLRAEASANSEALNKVPKGRTVTFISDAGNDESGYHFFKVYYLGQMGYVMSSYLEYVA